MRDGQANIAYSFPPPRASRVAQRREKWPKVCSLMPPRRLFARVRVRAEPPLWLLLLLLLPNPFLPGNTLACCFNKRRWFGGHKEGVTSSRGRERGVGGSLTHPDSFKLPRWQWTGEGVWEGRGGAFGLSASSRHSNTRARGRFCSVSFFFFASVHWAKKEVTQMEVYIYV